MVVKEYYNQGNMILVLHVIVKGILFLKDLQENPKLIFCPVISWCTKKSKSKVYIIYTW